ncbi:cilia- and flagella-associated protein 263 [Leptinotarsa decemlineata]|uniref:cilia- and flagella-associated protein 263 n=1 Tax=Leptinotarsa decemlineata TaxID=7539 RepID=UPI000C2525F3|nr:coiled-coil domain-containing protein 113 [Leptinotarsa decemlineata]
MFDDEYVQQEYDPGDEGQGSFSQRDSDITEEDQKHPLDDLSDQQLIDLISEMETEKRHLVLENMIFYDFLKNNDPLAMEGLESLFKYALGISENPNIAIFATDMMSASVSLGVPSVTRRSTKLDSYTSISSLIEGKGPKINLSQKNDMVLKATEEIQSSLEHYVKKSHRLKRNLKAELEEFSIREIDITEARNIFEFNIVTQAVDPLTQRIPAEKFVKYMEDWLKSATLNIEKLRLRTASLKGQLKKVSGVLIQRQELRENVHAVDFDQLEIENKHFLEKIEQKQLHLIELKKMNGGANLVLSKHKKYLQNQQEDYNKLKETVAEKEKETLALEDELDKTDDELNKVVEKYEYYRDMRNNYRVPDVMSYVNLKNELYELKKNMKILLRRKKIQDIALNACIREMMNITGSSKVDPYWFRDAASESGDSNTTLSEIHNNIDD